VTARAGLTNRQTRKSAHGLLGKIGPMRGKNDEKGVYKAQYEYLTY